MKSYSKLPAQEQAVINAKGIINYNFFTIQSVVQNILQHNQDMSLHTDINSCLERCINDMDNVLLKHSKKNENEIKKSANEDA